MADPEWARPGAYAVSPGVWRVPLPLPNDGLRAVNVYVLKDDAELVLIDGGWATGESRELLEKALAVLGVSLHDVHRFFVTHVHRDHYGQAVAIRREFGTRVGLGSGERPSLRYLQAPGARSLGAQVTRLRALGAPEMANGIAELSASDGIDQQDWTSPDDWLDEGVITLARGDLEAIATPGHTAGHMVFADREAGLLFGGDHVLPSITPSIGFEPVLTPAPLADFLSSLARVRAGPDATLLPAHGAVAPSVHARIDQLLEHHAARLDEIERLVSAGAETAFDVARAMRWTRHEYRLEDLDLFNQMLAVLEAGAHLDLLASQGRIA
jgi:glyoxylase-like metal-dependent hydrolase (beta-lactamase superfamily II)